MGEKKTLSDKMKAFDQSVDWFYSGEFSLNEAESRYQSLVDLAKELKNDLDGLENRIEVLAEDFSK